MQKLLSILFIAILLCGCSSDKYKLVWHDEFNIDGHPDSAKWDFNIGGHGWGNAEKQFYTDEISNARVIDGKLIITAREETMYEKSYTSARLTTKSTGGHFKYGKILARIKLPYGQGIWPAFWMLGANKDSIGWPGCGEIDIMEMVGGKGRENTTHGTMHWKDLDGRHAYKGSEYSLNEGIFADDFHLFSVEWDPEKINWFVDNNLIHSMEITSDEFDAFHKPFFLLLNVAVGGHWPGYPDSTTTFPQQMEIDYVRVFQMKSNAL